MYIFGYITREVVYLMALYFILSIIMAYLITKLPIWCQSWSLTSVWGITWAIVGYTIVYPEMYLHTIRLAFVFLAAYPGMLGLEFWQRWQRVHYWERVGLPKELQNKTMYLSDKLGSPLEWFNNKLDRWAFSRVDERMARDKRWAVEEAQRIAERDCRK